MLNLCENPLFFFALVTSQFPLFACSVEQVPCNFLCPKPLVGDTFPTLFVWPAEGFEITLQVTIHLDHGLLTSSYRYREPNRTLYSLHCLVTINTLYHYKRANSCVHAFQCFFSSERFSQPSIRRKLTLSKHVLRLPSQSINPVFEALTRLSLTLGSPILKWTKRYPFRGNLPSWGFRAVTTDRIWLQTDRRVPSKEILFL